MKSRKGAQNSRAFFVTFGIRAGWRGVLFVILIYNSDNDSDFEGRNSYGRKNREACETRRAGRCCGGYDVFSLCMLGCVHQSEK